MLLIQNVYVIAYHMFQLSIIYLKLLVHVSVNVNLLRVLEVIFVKRLFYVKAPIYLLTKYRTHVFFACVCLGCICGTLYAVRCARVIAWSVCSCVCTKLTE